MMDFFWECMMLLLAHKFSYEESIPSYKLLSANACSLDESISLVQPDPFLLTKTLKNKNKKHLDWELMHHVMFLSKIKN